MTMTRDGNRLNIILKQTTVNSAFKSFLYFHDILSIKCIEYIFCPFHFNEWNVPVLKISNCISNRKKVIFN